SGITSPSSANIWPMRSPLRKCWNQSSAMKVPNGAGKQSSGPEGRGFRQLERESELGSPSGFTFRIRLAVGMQTVSTASCRAAAFPRRAKFDDLKTAEVGVL